MVEKHQGWIKAQATAKDVAAAAAAVGGGGGGGGPSVAASAPASSGGMLRRRVITPGGGNSAAQLGSGGGGVTPDHFLAAMARTPYADGEKALSSLSRRAANAGAAAAAAAAAAALGSDSTAGAGRPGGTAAVAAAGQPKPPPPPPALRTAIMTAAGSPDAFIAMRRRYAASLAASSICGWVAGVGDRHLQNILIDLRDGSLVHIDFGYAFGTATAVLPIPELVPFRATGALLGALAPMDARAALSGDMSAAMHALRRGAALLRGVMDVFLREPLIDWQREARQVQVKAGKAVKAAKDGAGSGGGGGVGGGVGGVRGGASTAGATATATAVGGGTAAAAAAAAAVEGTSGLRGDEGRFVELKVAHAWCKLELGNPRHVALAQMCAAKHDGGAGARDIKCFFFFSQPRKNEETKYVVLVVDHTTPTHLSFPPPPAAPPPPPCPGCSAQASTRARILRF